MQKNLKLTSKIFVTRHINSRRLFILLLLIPFVFYSCKKKTSGELKIADTLSINIKGKINTITSIDWNNEKHILFIQTTREGKIFSIYNLSDSTFVKKIDNPTPFDWNYMCSIKNKIIFTDFMGGMGIYNLLDDTFETISSDDLKIPLQFFQTPFFSAGSNSVICQIAPSQNVIDLCMHQDIEKKKEGYIKFTKESKLIELNLSQNDSISVNTFMHGFQDKYLFREEGFGTPYFNIVKYEEDAYVFTTPYSDSIFWITKDSVKTHKVITKLEKIKADIVSYDYLSNPSDFSRRCSEGVHRQPGIRNMFFDKKNKHIYLEILHEQMNEKNDERLKTIVLMDTKGNNLAEVEIDPDYYSPHKTLIESKLFIARKYEYEKDSIITLDVFTYTIN